MLGSTAQNANEDNNGRGELCCPACFLIRGSLVAVPGGLAEPGTHCCLSPTAAHILFPAYNNSTEIGAGWVGGWVDSCASRIRLEGLLAAATVTTTTAQHRLLPTEKTDALEFRKHAAAPLVELV